MDVAMTKMSPNGQVVIPAEMRKSGKFTDKTKFLVVNKGGTLLLKPISSKFMEREFKLFESILRGKEDIKKGRYTTINTDMSDEEALDLLEKPVSRRR